MARVLRTILTITLAYIGISPVFSQELQPQTHPAPAGILGTLYSSTNQTRRLAPVTTIHQLVGFRNRLFVAVSDSSGHEIIDVWNTRDVAHPVLDCSVDFGSLQTNGVMFTPLAMVPSKDGLLLQVRTGLYFYRFQADGRLALDKTLPTPTTWLGIGMTQLHVAGGHASMLQQVIPNKYITPENIDQVHQEVLLDVSNPAEPIFLWAGSDGESIFNKDPLTARLGGNPAGLAYDANLNQARLTSYQSTRGPQRDVFWSPKLEKVFAAAALRKPLRTLVEEALGATNLPGLQASGIEVFARSNGLSSRLLGAFVLEHHAGTQTIKDVIAQYGVSLDEPLELALAKVIVSGMDTNLEARLAQEWYSPVLQSWMDRMLAPGVKLQTADQTREAIVAAFNLEIDEQTLPRYLTRHVISPVLGDPDFMKLTLDQLLDQAANSPPGEMMDVMLQTVGGFGLVNDLLDSVHGFISTVSGVDLPSLPACARFPESTAALLDLALFSWNQPGQGISLNRDGLAWFELLKFHRYLTGHTDFNDYTAEINQKLREMQRELGGNLAGRLSEAFDLPGGSVEWPVLHASVAGTREARLLAGRLVARGLIDSIPNNQLITPEMSLRSALTNWGLRVQQVGYAESKISDLVNAMQTRGLGQIALSAVYSQSAIRPVDLFRTRVGQVLRLQAQDSFGLSDLDRPLLDLVMPCLDYEVGVQRVMGSWMSGLLGDLLADGTGMGSLLLNYRNAFENHDCIARWLVVLDMIGNASALFGGDAAARALEYALHEAYSAGVGYLVQTMFGQIIHETGSRAPAAWLASQMSSSTTQWTLLEPVPNATTVTLGVFGWQERVAAVLQQRFETNWYGPRAVKLVLCHPDDPMGTRQVYDLGRWQTVNYVNQHQGALFLGGSYFAPGDGSFPSGKGLVIDLSTAHPRLQRLTGDAHTILATAPRLSGANYESCLAVGGLNRVFLIPNPSGASPLSEEPLQSPRIVQQLMPAEVVAGGTHHFQVRSIGTAPLSFQWYKDGTVLAGKTFDRLDVEAGTVAADGIYAVVVSNTAGSVTNSARLTVLDSEVLRIIGQPADEGRLCGQSVSFQVQVQSTNTVAYQWFHEGSAIASATQSRLTLTNLGWADAGGYFVRASHGSLAVRSRTATLDLIEAGAPILLNFPSDRQPLAVGTEGTLESSAVGWGDLSWRWFKEGKAAAGVTNGTLPLGLVAGNTAGGYQVEVTDAAGNIRTRSFDVVLVAAGSLTGEVNSQGSLGVSLTGGVPGQIYSIQRSTNLVNWTDAQTGTVPASGKIVYQDSAPASPGTGTYFRLKISP